MAQEMGGVVVTGAARGIRLAIAQHSARTGYGVVIGDIDEAAGKAAAYGIEAGGGCAIYCKLDVTDRSAVAAAIKDCEEVFGFLHGMVNNAGFNRPMPFLEATEENWTQIMAVNGLRRPDRNAGGRQGHDCVRPQGQDHQHRLDGGPRGFR